MWCHLSAPPQKKNPKGKYLFYKMVFFSLFLSVSPHSQFLPFPTDASSFRLYPPIYWFKMGVSVCSEDWTINSKEAKRSGPLKLMWGGGRRREQTLWWATIILGPQHHEICCSFPNYFQLKNISMLWWYTNWHICGPILEVSKHENSSFFPQFCHTLIHTGWIKMEGSGH